MKREFFCFMLLVPLAISAFYEKPQPHVFTLSEQNATNLYQVINMTRPVLLKSQLPSATVQDMFVVFDSVQRSIEVQYKMFYPDTTKKK